MTADLIEELAAVKDKFPAGSRERSVIWTAIEHLRGENAEIVRLRGEVAALLEDPDEAELVYRCGDPDSDAIAPAEAKGE